MQWCHAAASATISCGPISAIACATIQGSSPRIRPACVDRKREKSIRSADRARCVVSGRPPCQAIHARRTRSLLRGCGEASTDAVIVALALASVVELEATLDALAVAARPRSIRTEPIERAPPRAAAAPAVVASLLRVLLERDAEPLRGDLPENLGRLTAAVALTSRHGTSESRPAPASVRAAIAAIRAGNRRRRASSRRRGS